MSNILWSGVSVTREVVILSVLLVVSPKVEPIAVPEDAEGTLVSLVVEPLPTILLYYKHKHEWKRIYKPPYIKHVRDSAYSQKHFLTAFLRPLD